jgi:hypothetical protein
MFGCGTGELSRILPVYSLGNLKKVKTKTFLRYFFARGKNIFDEIFFCERKNILRRSNDWKGTMANPLHIITHKINTITYMLHSFFNTPLKNERNRRFAEIEHRMNSPG